SVIGKDICQAVKDFFVNGKLLGEVNATIISLVLKVPNPDRVSEFRPIACYNELFKGYYRKQKIKKVAFKIDLQKAYDTIKWDFLRVVLEQFGFPKKMVKWIMVCVSTTKFSININEEREGYFSGGRGLRQGDPMSPNLFTLVIEAFNLILRRHINDTKEFKYHQGCQKLGITHLCFADDLLVFCHWIICSISYFTVNILTEL
ncbi:RNA-directed DNA polymerase, eukaryota, reverse transcriptase zinc-binding domain protein, partial [Tanacetum coccineum]